MCYRREKEREESLMIRSFLETCRWKVWVDFYIKYVVIRNFHFAITFHLLSTASTQHPQTAQNFAHIWHITKESYSFICFALCSSALPPGLSANGPISSGILNILKKQGDVN
jgi:hypothetical protein